MSDAKIVNAGENTPEHVAYVLLGMVMQSEGKVHYKSDGKQLADRKYLLDTYAECITAVRAPHVRLNA